MKYVKTYEGWWFKKKKKKEIVNTIPDPINPLIDLRQKIDDALSKIHINGSNFVDVDHKGDPYVRYTSKIDLKVPIEGYIDTKLQLKRDHNRVNLYLSMLFDINSTVGNISDCRKHGSYVFSRNAMHDICTISTGISDVIDYKSSVEDIRGLLTSMFNNLLNIDFKEIQETIDKLESKRLERKRIQDEHDNKLLDLKNKLDELSDYLVDLEEMSTKYNKEFDDGKIILTYEIPGINVGKSDNDTAKLIINDVILNIMASIKTFTKRAEKEIQGTIVKSYFSTDKVTIKISIPSDEGEKIRFAGRRIVQNTIRRRR